jgi:glycosyltransferase involved in cell wall biosynthesis
MTPEPSAPPAPVRQRAVIVLPSTGEFDSRTYRIARTLHERGHEVTVLARWKPGLPRREVHPIGYPIIRVEASGIDGMPLPGLWRAARDAYRRLRGRPKATGAAPATGSDVAAAAAGTTAAPPSAEGTDPGWAHPSARGARGIGSYVRRVRIFLMIRSHRRRALEAAPAADVYHGMAYMGISVALVLGKKHRAKVLYDSRDIYMVAANLAKLRGPVKWVLTRMERGWARKADRVLTVNRPYAEELATRFGVPMPLIVMNCSYRYTPPVPRERRFHERLGLDPATSVVLYQGGLSPERGIEELLDAILLVPDTVLVMMGYGELEPKLRDAVASERYRGRAFLLPAVPPTELLDWVACADVVGAPFQPTTINHRLSTPNKFLEAMAAGVPTVVSDDPGMGPIATETGCGIAVDPRDPAAIAGAIRQLLSGTPEEREAWRARALAAAHDTYNWEVQVQELLDEYGRLTGRPW